MTRQNFPDAVKRAAKERSGGRCEPDRMPPAIRGAFPKECDRPGAEFDHISPDMAGGEPTLENCAHLCVACHKIKTAFDQADRRKRNAHRVRKDRPKSGWWGASGKTKTIPSRKLEGRSTFPKRMDPWGKAYRERKEREAEQ